MSETPNSDSPAKRNSGPEWWHWPLGWLLAIGTGGLLYYSDCRSSSIPVNLWRMANPPSPTKPNGRISIEEEMANRAEYEGRHADAEKHRQRAKEERAYQEWKKKNGK